MQYTFKKIGTVAQCDVLLTKAQKKQLSLERRRRNLGAQIDAFRARLDRMNEESEVVRISTDAFTKAYHALPEGKYKSGMWVKIKRMEVRQARLEVKELTCNVAALLVKEMKHNVLDSQVLAVAQYIAAVKYLRMTLGKAALRVSQKSASSPVPAEGQPAVEIVRQAYDSTIFALAGQFHAKHPAAFSRKLIEKVKVYLSGANLRGKDRLSTWMRTGAAIQ
jgi:hypothetical protein